MCLEYTWENFYEYLNVLICLIMQTRKFFFISYTKKFLKTWVCQQVVKTLGFFQGITESDIYLGWLHAIFI